MTDLYYVHCMVCQSRVMLAWDETHQQWVGLCDTCQTCSHLDTIKEHTIDIPKEELQ